MTGFLASNWIWIVLIVAMVAMHRRGSGCRMHTHHDGHRHQTPEPDTTGRTADREQHTAARTDTNTEASR